jgi:hypothetical protein
MTIARRAVSIGVLVLLLGGAAAAQESPPKIQRSHDPGLAAAVALINVVYIPVRLALTAVGAALGGFTGFITFGDLAAAEAIWALTDGSMVITPEMLNGTERWHFSAYD